MKRPYTENEVQLLTERVIRTMSAIDIVYKRVDSSYSNLKESLQNIIKEECDSSLRCIEVEQLLEPQFEDLFGLLHGAGLEDTYSILNAGVQRLAKTPGIGQAEAESIAVIRKNM